MRRCWLLALMLVLVLGLVMPMASIGVAAGQRVAAGRDAPPSVVGTRYTSPQFGFQVSWAAPWTLGQEPVSKTGQYDALSLVAGKLAIDYAGIVTTLDPAAFFRGAVAVRRQQFPDLVVLQPYLPVTPQLPGILRYSVSGVAMIDLVYLQPLVPGRSLLMTAESFPADTAREIRTQADGAVHLASVELADGATRPEGEEPRIAPPTLVTRLLDTPLTASELPSGDEVQSVAEAAPAETDPGAIGRIEVKLASEAGSRALAYIVYATDADAQHAYVAWLVDARISDGGRISPVTGLADDATLILVPGSTTASGTTTATGASVLIRQGNVLVLASAANPDAADPAPSRQVAFALAQAGLAHLQQVLAAAGGRSAIPTVGP